jgi:hypothetical protein
MEWLQFLKVANHQYKADDIHLGYSFGGSGEACALSQLDCGYDWNTTMVKTCEKAMSVRTCAKLMEL